MFYTLIKWLQSKLTGDHMVNDCFYYIKKYFSECVQLLNDPNSS